VGHAFNEFIVCTIRQAVPVVSAVMGAFYGSARASRTGGKQLPNIAAFAGLGWLGGYVLRSALIFVIEGGRKSLPARTARQFPPPPEVQPAPTPSMAAPPTSGLPHEVDPYSVAMPESNNPADRGGGDVPPPKADNEGVNYGSPPAVGGGMKKRKNNTLTTAAYGSVYGN